MSTSVNKVILVGRLGKDPVIKQVGDTSVANFSLATDESYTDRNGDKQKKTEWHNIVVWGKAVESFIKPYIHAGDLVYVEGKLQTRSWEKDGVTKYTTEVNVADIKGLKSAGGGDGQPAARPAQRQAAPAGRPAARPATRPAAPPVDDEDIPF